MSAYAENILGGDRASHGGPPMPTPEQIELGMSFHGHLVACAIERTTERDGPWFTLATLGLSSSCAAVLSDGVRLGLWKDTGKYYKHNHITWPWVRTVVARNTAPLAQKVN